MVRIGFIGLGLMGQPIVSRALSAGLQVAMWNRSPKKADKLKELGGLLAKTPARAADGAELICLCLTDAEAVEQVIFGEHGIVEGLSPTSLLVDFSTIGVAPTVSFAARLFRETGVHWVDAPLSGGPGAAAAGTLTILCGGNVVDCDRAHLLFAILAHNVTRFGGVGSGQAAKLCNQLIVANSIVAIAEAMMLGRTLGIDITLLPSGLAGGFADSKPLQIFGSRMAAQVDPGPALGELRTMAKDMRAVRACLADHAAHFPLFDVVEAMYERAIAMGLGHDDLPSIMRVYEQEPERDER